MRGFGPVDTVRLGRMTGLFEFQEVDGGLGGAAAGNEVAWSWRWRWGQVCGAHSTRGGGGGGQGDSRLNQHGMCKSWRWSWRKVGCDLQRTTACVDPVIHAPASSRHVGCTCSLIPIIPAPPGAAQTPLRGGWVDFGWRWRGGGEGGGGQQGQHFAALSPAGRLSQHGCKRSVLGGLGSGLNWD
jgi:hypothetical protein